MGAPRCCRDLRRLWLVGLVFSASVRAEPSSRVELTCLLDSGDVLGAADAGPIEDPPWQNLASLRPGDGNRARLAVLTEEIGFLPNIKTSAVLRGELIFADATASQAPRLRDLSSSVGVSWQLAAGAELVLRAFPFDTDYVRLGYLHALDWGGTDSGRGESVFLRQTGAVPGLSIALNAGKARLFAALKWASLERGLAGRRRLWGVLSGASAELTPALRIDGGFGYFQRPKGAPFGNPERFVEGGSVRIVWHQGIAEPELSAEPFRPPQSSEDADRLDANVSSGWAMAVEGVTLVQRRERSSDPNAATLEAAPGAALYGSIRGHALAAHAALSWRSLPFVLRNEPQFGLGEALPLGGVEQAEVTAWLGSSASVPSLLLVPSVELGLRLPAALRTASILPGFTQAFVATGAAGLAPLPVGAGPLPVVSARLGARFQASRSVAFSAFAELTRDPNRVALATTPWGVTRQFTRPERLELVATAQARF